MNSGRKLLTKVGQFICEGFKVLHTRWSDATLDDIREYQNCLDDLLTSDLIPWEAINCADYFCDKHYSEIQTFHDNVIHACITASVNTLPGSQCKGHGKKRCARLE